MVNLSNPGHSSPAQWDHGKDVSGHSAPPKGSSLAEGLLSGRKLGDTRMKWINELSAQVKAIENRPPPAGKNQEIAQRELACLGEKISECKKESVQINLDIDSKLREFSPITYTVAETQKEESLEKKERKVKNIISTLDNMENLRQEYLKEYSSAPAPDSGETGAAAASTDPPAPSMEKPRISSQSSSPDLSPAEKSPNLSKQIESIGTGRPPALRPLGGHIEKLTGGKNPFMKLSTNPRRQNQINKLIDKINSLLDESVTQETKEDCMKQLEWLEAKTKKYRQEAEKTKAAIAANEVDLGTVSAQRSTKKTKKANDISDALGRLEARHEEYRSALTEHIRNTDRSSSPDLSPADSNPDLSRQTESTGEKKQPSLAAGRRNALSGLSTDGSHSTGAEKQLSLAAGRRNTLTLEQAALRTAPARIAFKAENERVELEPGPLEHANSEASRSEPRPSTRGLTFKEEDEIFEIKQHPLEHAILDIIPEEDETVEDSDDDTDL